MFVSFPNPRRLIFELPQYGVLRAFTRAMTGVILQWVRVPPGNGSPQPVAIGAVRGGNESPKHPDAKGRESGSASGQAVT